MSYSFSAQAASKAAVIEQVKEKMAEVVRDQPSHEADQAQAIAAVEGFVGVLADIDTLDVNVEINGSIWSTAEGLRSASVNVQAALVDRK